MLRDWLSVPVQLACPTDITVQCWTGMGYWYWPGFESWSDQIIWLHISSEHTLRLISQAGKRVWRLCNLWYLKIAAFECHQALASARIKDGTCGCRLHRTRLECALAWGYEDQGDLRAPSTREHPSYGDCLEVKREYYQNSSVLDCMTQCSQSAAHLCEQFLQVKQVGFVTLGPLRCA